MKIRDITEGVGRITKQNQTVDVGPDEVTKQAAKFGNKVDKDGRPPTLSKRVKGKSTNVLFNLGLAEGYKLQLERDKEMLVLNITDTATGKRTEVRGKSGYESGGYDPNDSLHILLDKVGKSANISELMNGEVVTINPNHPDATKAKAATDVAYNEALDQPYPVRWVIRDDDEWEGKAKTEAGDSIQIFITQGHNNHKWEVDFYVGGSMQVTGKGDQFRVFATVVSAVKKWWAWLSKSKQPVEAIIFSAFKGNKSAKGSTGRSSLYNRFANQFARSIGFDVSTVDGSDNIKFVLSNPNYKNQQTENFADSKNQIKEALDNPYPFKLTGPDESQSFVATAQTPNGPLIMDFSSTDFDDFSIDFAVAKSMGKTGAGDEFRVFATVVAMMKKWIDTVGIEHVESFDFGANKDEHASDGRAKLYARFAKQLASQLGWKLEQSTTANNSTAFFKLTNPKPVPRDDEYWDALEENFADGKKKGKSRPGRVKRAGASCNGSVTALRKRAKNASGEKAKMYHWCANMKSGRKKK